VRILLVRHAPAVERALWRGEDAGRPLTEEGERRFRKGARALVALVPDLERILASPLTRGRQTAALLADEAARRGIAPAVEIDAGLAPGRFEPQTADRLRRALAAPGGTLALVGHEPDLSILEARLLTGRDRPLAAFRKGGAALLEVDPAGEGRALLVWHLTAAQLRGLA